MKVHFSMWIRRSLDTSSDQAQFKDIVEFCKAEGLLSKFQLADLERNGGNVDSITPHCPSKHPKIPELLTLVERMGCTIYERNIPKDHGPKPIAWSIVREMTMRENKAAECVLVADWGCTTGGHFLSQNCPVTYSDEKMGELLKKRFLWYSAGGLGVVNDKGFRILEEAGIKGAVFDPIKWSNPEDVKGALYKVLIETIMPPCLLPVIEHQCGALLYHEGPYYPPILRYRRSEVESMGEWDIAQTAEITGSASPPLFHRRCVISARFRDVLLENKIPLTATPVVLVDD